jgi:glycosyltransferase involved in cell wall biosynthesis
VRTLLEAASMARPLITTDWVGCRDALDDGINGYLVRVADSNDLAEKCRRFVALSNDEQARMGQASRRKAEREFDEQLVFDKYVDCLRALRAAARAR